jgi:glycerol-3-phosphate dehydrogenase (NAD(P)+)
MNDKISVVGGGSWGSTLADLLGRNGQNVTLWEFVPQVAAQLNDKRTLAVMPELNLHPGVHVTNDLSEAVSGARAILSVVPSEFVRGTFKAIKKTGKLSDGAFIISASKGVENDSLLRMSEVIVQEIPSLAGKVCALSGPSHAEEVVRGVPTAVVSAGPGKLPEQTQDIFNTDNFRVYTSSDMTGVELGGALKNIYAIACGACDGLGLGDNTKAALMTRGLNEIVRIGMAQRAQAMTFLGLSGMGDLIVTCLSRHSRNRLLGEKIGKGLSLKEALGEMTMVAEGVRTTKSAFDLARKCQLDLPIINEIYRCLYEGKSAKDSLRDLTHRPVTSETEHFKGGEAQPS